MLQKSPDTGDQSKHSPCFMEPEGSIPWKLKSSGISHCVFGKEKSKAVWPCSWRHYNPKTSWIIYPLIQQTPEKTLSLLWKLQSVLVFRVLCMLTVCKQYKVSQLPAQFFFLDAFQPNKRPSSGDVHCWPDDRQQSTMNISWGWPLVRLKCVEKKKKLCI